MKNARKRLEKALREARARFMAEANSELDALRTEYGRVERRSNKLRRQIEDLEAAMAARVDKR